ncbi:MAG: hypothetical protein QW774_04040 [Candidatus Micrarchaeaceae archaeon]
MDLPKEDKIGLALAFSIIVITVLAIAVFIAYGGGVAFYAVIVIGLILGFYMAYYISRVTAAQQAQAAQQAKKGKRRR